VLEKALAHTGRTFREAQTYPVLAEGQNIAFSIYGLYHRQIALAGAQGLPAADAPRTEGWRRWARGCRTGAALFLPFLYSLASLAWLAATRKARTAIWTGDFLDARTRADFRVGDLYRALADGGIPFVEFIRGNQAGFPAAWKNAVARRRPAVYYEALTFFLGGLFPSPSLPEAPEGLSRAYRRFRADLDGVARSIPILRAAYRIAGVRELIAWEYSDRQAGLIHAARSLDIPVIGFMHGAGMLAYMAHEFIPEYQGPGPLGPDVFGVWSEWWAGYFRERSRLYGRLEVSGTLRKSRRPRKAGAPRGPIRKVLWISEPLGVVEESLPYLRALRAGFEVGIKKRPSTSDRFYNALLAADPGFRDLEARDGDIFEAIAEYDPVVGSHSTAVLDATWLDKPFVFVDTPKWGDYFELAGSEATRWLLARDPASLVAALRKWEGADAAGVCAEVRERYYGDPARDGCAWIVETIKGMRGPSAASAKGAI